MAKINKKQKRAEPSEFCHIKVIDDTHEELIYEGDDEPYGRRDCFRTHHHIRGIEIVGENSYYDLTIPFIPNFNDPVFLLYAVYDTGDSFGHDEGRICFIDAFKTREKAITARDAVGQGKVIKGRRREWETNGYEYLDEVGTKHECGYAPWQGYFERLEYITVETVYLDKIKK